MKQIKIAVDGPSGAGKSTISKRIAQDMNLIYIDTGAMYRAVGVKALRAGINSKRDSEKMEALIKQTDVSLKYIQNQQRVLLDGEDVTDCIRTPEVSIAASDVAALLPVRKRMVELQQKLAEENSVIMDGRDIGSNVLPDADIKIFLTADLNVRAKRRFEELSVNDPDITLEEVQKDMAYRDQNDTMRSHSPLIVANGAMVVDTSKYSFEQSVVLLEAMIKERLHVL